MLYIVSCSFFFMLFIIYLSSSSPGVITLVPVKTKIASKSNRRFCLFKKQFINPAMDISIESIDGRGTEADVLY